LLNPQFNYKRTQPEFIFYKRAELGLYNVLHQLGARVRTRDLLGRMMKE